MRDGRCVTRAFARVATGRLVGIPVAGVSRRRQVMLVCRRAHRSHAADAFLEVAQEKNPRLLRTL